MKTTEAVPVAVFASGRGSNFDAILAAVRAGKLAAKIVAVVSDQPKAPVLEKAKAAGIPTIVVPWADIPKDRPIEERRRLHEEKVAAELKKVAPRFLIMAGYMRIMTRYLIDLFRDPRGYTRIVNVHPSLLPAFPGVDAYRQAFEYGAKLAGVTVHLVDVEVDGGPICAQEAFSIADCRSPEEVETRGLAVEHRLFPETLRWVLTEKFEIEGATATSPNRRTIVRPS